MVALNTVSHTSLVPMDRKLRGAHGQVFQEATMDGQAALVSMDR